MTQVLCDKIISRILIDAFMKADRWIDYQDVFKKRFDLDRCYSLEDALESAEIEPKGRFHDGRCSKYWSTDKEAGAESEV